MRHITIGLLWHESDSKNQGVNALSISNISIIDDLAKQMNIEIKYVLFANGDSTFQKWSSNEVQIRSLPSYRELLLNSRKSKTLFSDCTFCIDSSAGDSFSDIYGLRRFANMFATKLLVIKAEKRLVLSPQTIGPFRNRFVRALARKVLKRAALVFARDKQSMLYCDSITSSRSSIETTDVAFALPFVKAKYADLPTCEKIGINISGLLYNGGYTQSNQFELKLNYRQFVRDLVEMCMARSNTRVYLIPHVYNSSVVEDDRIASEDVSKSFPNVFLAPEFTDPVDAKSFISNMDVFVGSRMHSTIASFSSGVPTIPVSYSRKFEGLFGSLGYNRIVSGKREDTNTAIEKIRKYLDESSALGLEVSEGMQIAEGLLEHYRIKLGQFLRSIAHE